MKQEILIKRLIDCIYKYDGNDKVSVSKLKQLINELEGNKFPKARYSRLETRYAVNK